MVNPAKILWNVVGNLTQPLFMKGKLKALIRSYTDDYYLLDFDMSQVEYRIMVSLAKYVDMIRVMNNPERDYHTETASLLHGVPAHLVSKKLRNISLSWLTPYFSIY